jgi:outer membrane protein assembly factor BamA
VTLALAAGGQAPPSEVVAQISVHGNLLTPTEEVVRLAGVTVGMPFEASTIDTVTSRLRAARRFQTVEVLKRFASIADPTQIILVILVDDGHVDVDWTSGAVKAPRFGRRHGPRLMYMPLLDAEDGYGFSYGVQIAVPDPIGARSRLAFPLTWGGERHAGAQLEKDLDRGPFTHVDGGVSISRRENPFFHENDDRRRVWMRGQREIASLLRAGATASLNRASFFDSNDTFSTVGGDIEFDTRVDPVLPRNAVFARAAWDHLSFRNADSANQTTLDGRGYVGLLGQTMLAVRAMRQDSTRPLPSYLKPLLGGMASLRGFKAGSAVGDTLVSGSAELFVPLTSPLNVGRLGVSAFIDAATIYDKRQRLRDQDFEQGVGGSVWFSAAIVRLNLAVAHGIGADTRVHFGTTVSF